MRKSLFFALTLLVTLASILTFTKVEAQNQVTNEQRLAMYSKPAVVRILDGYIGYFYWPPTNKTYTVPLVGSGSGSFIDPNGYIATNAHVVDMTKQGDDKAKEALFQQFVILLARDYNTDPRSLSAETINGIANKAQLQDMKHIHHVLTPDGSNFPFEIKAFGAPIGEGKDVSIIKIEIKNAPILKVGDSDKVQLQDHITVFGYPGAADTGLLDNKSFVEASITDGKVSARKNSQDGAPILQISAPTTHGNSGGPVVNDKGEIVGLLTFRGDTVNGQEVQGFNFVVPSSTVMEFVKQSGATNTEGLVDKRYREGLESYWNNRYTEAIQKFEEVARLFPQHSETTKLIQQSQVAKAEGKEASGFGGLGMIVIGGGVLLLILGGGVLLLLMMRKKGPKQPVQQGFPQPGGMNQPYPQQAGINQSFPPQPNYQGQPNPQFHPPQGQPMPPPMQAQRPMPPPMPQPMPPPAAQPAKTVVFASPAQGGTTAVPASHGAIIWQTGPLAGKSFNVTAEGFFIGRDANSAQVVIEDPRVSSRHAWVGLRNGQVVLVDSGSTNGTFKNTIASGRVQEIPLTPGDVIIFSEADVARFVYQK
ncbi:MAG: trypsin-like peptidase domain-containing protein [Acidobacteriota bacterium]